MCGSIFYGLLFSIISNSVGCFIFSKFGIKNKKPVIDFIDKQMIKLMTGEEERIFSFFPENISYFFRNDNSDSDRILYSYGYIHLYLLLRYYCNFL